jgi:hypothetical protein
MKHSRENSLKVRRAEPAPDNSARGQAAAPASGDAGLSLTPVHGPAFVSGDGNGDGFWSTAFITAKLDGIPLEAGQVTWTALRSSDTDLPAWNRAGTAMNGLAWGAAPLFLTGSEAPRKDMRAAGLAPNGGIACLTDIVGSRLVRVRAEVAANGRLHTAETEVSFGPGPLSVFAGVPQGRKDWTAAMSACGGPGNLDRRGYQPGAGLPLRDHLQAVSGPGADGQWGAAYAAGWPDGHYWTGEALGDGVQVWFVSLFDGRGLLDFWVYPYQAVGLRPGEFYRDFSTASAQDKP